MTMRSDARKAALFLRFGLAASIGCSGSSNTPGDDNGSGGGSGGDGNGLTADYRAVAAYDSIPANVVTAVSNLNIYYGHTSHGSQLVTGVGQLPSDHQFANLQEEGGDLGSGDWVTPTKNHLADHPETDVVLWSWCGQQSSNAVAVVQTYLDDMDKLEAAYPNVQFIYMTGHLRSSEVSDYLYDSETNFILQRNNKQVRDYCAAHGKWLFDFADIESYLDASTTQCLYDGFPTECDWPETNDGSCVHSAMSNCIRKGKALYWLLARMTGWEG